MQIKELLEAVKNRTISVEEAMEQLKDLPYAELPYAKVDHHRQLRTGFPEVVFGLGKTPEQIAEIFAALFGKHRKALATRATQEQFAAVRARVPQAEYDAVSRTISAMEQPWEGIGRVAVCCGGTADLPVAEEAVVTARMCGAAVERFYDIGVSGIHRLLTALPEIRKAHAVVAVAGMEGALASVLAGQIDKPVIAVPTSVGYGANFGGVSSLLTMLNSCAAGIGVVNIDNGFGGGYLAAQINRLAQEGKGEHE